MCVEERKKSIYIIETDNNQNIFLYIQENRGYIYILYIYKGILFRVCVEERKKSIYIIETDNNQNNIYIYSRE